MTVEDVVHVARRIVFGNDAQDSIIKYRRTTLCAGTIVAINPAALLRCNFGRLERVAERLR